jgi:glycosyltransferase involved in cell wall biosynthesis
MKEKIILDIVMLSNYGKQEGGRETWLHNFLPELLKDNSISKIHIFGFRTLGQADNSELLKNLDTSGAGRIIPVILESAPTKYPKFITMFKLLRQTLKTDSYTTSTHAMAVGGILETLMLRFIGRFKKATRIVWLRSIFTQEKAYRIPSFGMSTVRYFEKQNLKKTANIIIVNGDDTKNFYAQYNLTIHTIKNAINVEKWHMPSMKPSDVLHVAYIGRLSKVKGIEAYFDLAKKMKATELASKFVFHVVGEANNYEEEVLKLNEENIVTFRGAIDNDKLPEFLEQIHICVALTFVSDKLGGAGLSNALIEQMAAEKIIVAWDNNAFNQILDETSSFQVTQYNIKDLVAVMKTIFHTQEKAFKRASIAKEVVKPYTMEAHVKKFIKVLEGYESSK